MKVCINCGAILPDDNWVCTSCHWEATKLDGYLSFAPTLARGSEGFKQEYFSELAELEENNFWFRSRNRVIVWALGHYFPSATSFLEVGCGTGYVLSGINRSFPKIQLWGSEIYCTALEFAAARVENATLFQMDARKIPYENEFDVIGAFDVLEHIEEDKKVLQQIYRAVKPGGGTILTVPQHPFLWSQQDEAACHIRRYRKLELKKKVEDAGFRVERSTSFVSLLLPLMVLSRLCKRAHQDQYDPMAELKMGIFANTILENIMNIERVLIKWGIDMSVGGSLLVIAKKP